MLDLTMARRLLREVVEEQGRDFVYNSEHGHCFYVPVPVVQGWVDSGLLSRTAGEVRDLFADDYDPSTDNRCITGCLVGRVLDKAGETRHRTVQCISLGVWYMYSRFPGMMTEDAAQYLVRAQIKQDDGWTWGEVYDYTEGGLPDDAPSMADAQ